MKTLYDSSDLEVVSLDFDEAAQLLDIFSSIALEQGWDPGDDLYDYPKHAIYFAARRNGCLVGGIKLVMGNSEALPVSRVWPETNLLGRADVADLALIALRHEDRGDLATLWTICVEMWRYCADRGVSEIWSEVPPRNLNLYRRIGWPLKEMGELREHWGEPCLPCMVLVDELFAAVEWRARESTLFQKVYHQASRQKEHT